MSGNPNYPYSLPLVLEQPEAWPFDLIIKDADGYEVISQRRYAHTSKDKSVADVVEAVNFGGGERDHAAFCNAEQVARFNLVVTAVNSYASSKAEIERLRAALEPFDRAASALFTRNYNKRDVVVALPVDKSHPNQLKLTAADFFAVRAALSGSKE